jgi:hypothetical protein
VVQEAKEGRIAMPFDGSGFSAPQRLPVGLFPIWSRHGWRLWIKTHLRRSAEDFIPDPTPWASDGTVVRLLRDAKGLIEDREKWGQVWYFSLERRRCTVGALRAAAKNVRDPSVAWTAHWLLLRVAQSRGFETIEVMNDRSSHDDVLRAFDEAIGVARVNPDP